MGLAVCVVFLLWLRRIFTVTIRWLDYTLSKEEYALTIQSAIDPFLINDYVIYLCFNINFVGAGPYFFLFFLEISIKVR